MNITELKKCLPTLLKNDIVPFIWGVQGIGKTQVVGQVAKSLGIGFIPFHLSTQADVGDLTGLLMTKPDGSCYHTRPDWWPTEGEGVIFLDELNRASPEIIQAMFSFITHKSIHKHVLPPGWKIVAAGNYQTNQFNVTDTSDAAWMSRFCHIDLKPTVDEFVLYAENKGASRVAQFIRTQPDCLEAKVTTEQSFNPHMVKPDRRSWLDMIAKLENEDMPVSIRHELYSGIVGVSAASAFVAFAPSDKKVLTGMDVLASYPTHRKYVLSISGAEENRFDLLVKTVDEITSMLSQDSELFNNVTYLDNFKQFMLDSPAELCLKIVEQLKKISFAKQGTIFNNKEFVQQLAKKFDRTK